MTLLLRLCVCVWHWEPFIKIHIYYIYIYIFVYSNMLLNRYVQYCMSEQWVGEGGGCNAYFILDCLHSTAAYAPPASPPAPSLLNPLQSCVQTIPLGMKLCRLWTTTSTYVRCRQCSVKFALFSFNPLSVTPPPNPTPFLRPLL